MKKKEVDALLETVHRQVEAERNVPLPLRQVLEEAYGQAGVLLAKEKARWHRHENGGGWVRDDARVDAGAFLGPQSAVHGPRTSLGPNTKVEGRAVVGAGVRATGKTRIDSSLVTAEETKTPGLGGARLKGIDLIGSEVSYAFVQNSSLVESRVRQGRVQNSTLTGTHAHGVDALNISDSSVTGAEIDNSVVANSVVGKKSLVREALLVDTDLKPGRSVVGVEMAKGHVERPQLPDYDAYEAMERSGAAKPRRSLPRQRVR